MVDLENIEHIYIFPGLTNMRLGIFCLRKLIIETSKLEPNSLYIFCSKNRKQVKLIEILDSSIWLYQNKLVQGKFLLPMVGEKSELTKKQLKLIIEGSGLVDSIEKKGKKNHIFKNITKTR